MADFKSILDMPASEVERPKPLPQGTYQCVVDGPHREGKSSQKGTDFVEFSLKPMAALGDVDEEALATALTSKDGSVKALSDKRIRATFYITPDSTFRLTDFLEKDLQIDLEDKSVGQALSEAPNREVLAYLKHVPTNDGTGFFAQLGRTAPVQE